MTKRRLPKFLTSVSAKLLFIILLTGVGINFSIIFFVGAFQHLASGAFPSHITRYVDYLVEELGSPPSRERAGQLECEWQRTQLPEAIRALVIDDQRLRNDICWSVFTC